MQNRPAAPVRRVIAAILVLLVAVFAVRLIQARGGSNGKEPTLHSPLPVEVVTVRAEVVGDSNTLSAEIQPFRVATVSAEAADRIVERPIASGQRVSAGQTIAILDSSTASNTLQRAVAASMGSQAAVEGAEQDYRRAAVETTSSLQAAEAQLAQALANEQKVKSFTRPQELKTAQAALDGSEAAERLARLHEEHEAFLQQHDVVPQEALDSARTTLAGAVAKREAAQQTLSLARQGARPEDIEAAEAQVDAARAAVRTANTRGERSASLRDQIGALRAQGFGAAASTRQAQIALRRHRVMAPFGGRVLATLVEAGEMTAPGAPIARIGDISRVKVSFAAPEAARPALRLGLPVPLTVDALGGRHFSGRITALGYQADPRSRTFPVGLTVENPDEALLPNMLARVTLPVGPVQRRLLIPAGAVGADAGGSFVYVVARGRALRRSITAVPGPGEWVEATRGLEAGDQIASSPERLTDGAAVRPLAK